ncbi:MAG: sulfatase-like hydrolase/transferase [Rikenellaceae bacterium]
MKRKILLAISLFFSTMAFAQKKQKPNVLFIFADDLTIKGLNSTSDGEVIAPHLERIKKQGAFFTHTFNPGAYNGAISAASRAMINTGMSLWDATDAIGGKPSNDKYEWPEGIEPYKVNKPEQRPTLWSEYMREEGYETYQTGKWHVPVAATEVFDHANITPGSMPNQHKDCYAREFIKGVEDKWTASDSTYGGYWKGGQHWSELVRDHALNYLDHSKTIDKPFFMYIGFNAPHDPRQSPQEYLDMYDVDQVSVPESFVEIYPYATEIGAGPTLRDEQLAPFPRTEYSVQVNRKEYFSLITHMDAQIGMILDKLEETGQADNTYIIFTADHGLAVGDHGFIGKQNLYDPSIRVPMLISGPGIKPGIEIDELIYLQDAMATVLDIADSDADVYFQSFLPLAKGEKAETRDAVINTYIGCQRMIRTDRYKLMIYPSISMVRLYDMKKDPNELNDLAGNKKYDKLMNELFAEFQELQKEVRDPLDVTPYFNEFMANKNK